MFFTILSIHLLGAAIWTGGHLVLALTVLPRAQAAADPKILLDFEQGFEKVGIPALVAQVLSGLWLALQHEPDLSLWLPGSGGNSAITLKLVLLASTALLALNARFRVIPHLSPQTLALMGWHIRAVTLLSVLFVLTGVVLRSGGF